MRAGARLRSRSSSGQMEAIVVTCMVYSFAFLTGVELGSLTPFLKVHAPNVGGCFKDAICFRLKQSPR